MRVCQVLAGNEEGGLEKHVVELSNRLSPLYDIHVIAHPKYRDRFDKHVTFHAIDLSKSRKNPIVLYKLLQTIRQISPDIVHAHANKAVDMIATVKSLFNDTVKTVATLHSSKRKVNSFERFDYVIGVSHAVLRNVNTPDKSVVYNGIDIPHIPYRENFLHQFGIKNEFVICSVGRLEEVKNLPLIIHAVKDLDVKLLIVGDGSLKSSLQILVEKLDMVEKVVFTGHRNDATHIIAHSDLCVISSDKEGFPYVAVEALLLETPIVSTNISDMSMLLPKSYIVPIGDVKRMSETIAYVQHSYQTVKDTYRKHFDFAKRHFTLDAMTKNILLIYKKLMNNKY